MESITKSKLTYEKINEMTKRAFGHVTEIETIAELKDGFFNTAYIIALTNGLKTVLKVSPPKSVLVMRHEKNIMEAEVYVLNEIRLLEDIPAPKIFYYDQSGEIIENDFFFMEYIDGSPLNKIRSELSEEQYREISSELGYCVKKIHSIEGSYFGYISQNDKRFETWDEAFLSMIRELLDDAMDVEMNLPYCNDDIYQMIYDKKEILREVKTSSLIHKDLWEGNIFVDTKTAKISGLIDCERAIYGDILLELVCGFFLDNEDFMISYMGRVELDKNEKIRIVIYRIYLFLIMTIESSYRKYPDENSSDWPREQLKAALDELKELE